MAPVISVKGLTKTYASGLKALQAVDLTIVGHARQAGNGPNPARQVAIAAGIPQSATAWTLNQACASGLSGRVLVSTSFRIGASRSRLAAGPLRTPCVALM